MSKENILYDSSKSEIVIKIKEDVKRTRKYTLFIRLFIILMSSVLIIFLWSIDTKDDWFFWLIGRIFSTIVIVFLNIIMFLVIEKINQKLWGHLMEDIVIGKEFIEVIVFENRYLFEKMKIPMNYIDKLEININCLFINRLWVHSISMNENSSW